MRDRYVLLGVAPARTLWFRQVSRWSSAASIPCEFVRCISVAELRARITSGRTFSAVLADGGMGGVDRDLLAVARHAGLPVIVVDDGSARPWTDLGAAAVLPSDLDRDGLLEALAAHAQAVDPGLPQDGPVGETPDAPERGGAVVAVTGPGGTGASTVAIATAQGLAAGDHGQVLLADLCRRADQAMLHDARVVVPGIQELVESHRAGRPRPADVHGATFDVVERGYRLLLGLRRPRHWVTIRPQPFEATLDSLQRTFDVVVADLDPDVEGEDETGSLDVEERHLMTRATALRASAVLVVARPGLQGLHGLVRVLLDLLGLGVPAGRLVPVIVPAPRSPRDRADLTTSLAALARASIGATASALPSPLFLPRRKVDATLRDGVPLPRPLPDLLAGAVAGVLDRRGHRAPVDAEPERVAPGSLSLFTSQEGTA